MIVALLVLRDHRGEAEFSRPSRQLRSSGPENLPKSRKLSTIVAQEVSKEEFSD
jgi:hypothetical protein